MLSRYLRVVSICHLPGQRRTGPVGPQQLYWHHERGVPAGLGEGEAEGNSGAKTERTHYEYVKENNMKRTVFLLLAAVLLAASMSPVNANLKL